MSARSSDPAARALGRLARVAVGTVVGLLVLMGSCAWVTRRAERAAEESWRGAGASRESVAPDALPACEESPSVAELRVAAAALGVALSSDGGFGSRAVTGLPAADAVRLLDAVASADAAAAVPAPSPPLAAWMFAEAPRRSAVVEACLAGDGIRWRSTPARGFAEPLPPVLGLVRLQQLLAAAAVVDALRGDARLAEREIDAAWTLNESLLAHGNASAVRLALEETPRLLGALRVVGPEDVETWTARLEARDSRRHVVSAMHRDAVALHAAAASSAWLPPHRWPWLPSAVRSRLESFGGTPTRVLLEGAAAELGRLAAWLSAHACSDGVAPAEAAVAESLLVPAGLVGDLVVGHGRAWTLAVREQADLWMTRDVVMARARARGREVASRGRPGGACPGWAVAESGGVVRFAGDLPPAPQAARGGPAPARSFVASP